MNIEKYQIKEEKEINLKEIKTDEENEQIKSKKESKIHRQINVKKISKLQNILFAEHKQSLLVIFQALDCGGKDGTIRRVFKGINPQGINVISFKTPTNEDLDHDFLWRCSNKLPERGKIGVFNRSYYEEVFIVRVHRDLLLNQPLPEEILKSADTEKVWNSRFDSIRHFEKHLSENGIRLVKIYLHISKEEQKKRFLARINEIEKNWKFTEEDAKEREFFDDYLKVYGEAIGKTSKEFAPWYIVPADKKWLATSIVSEIILQNLLQMKPRFPLLSDQHRLRLLEAKKILENEQQ